MKRATSGARCFDPRTRESHEPQRLVAVRNAPNWLIGRGMRAAFPPRSIDFALSTLHPSRNLAHMENNWLLAFDVDQTVPKHKICETVATRL